VTMLGLALGLGLAGCSPQSGGPKVDAGIDARPICGVGFLGDPASPVAMQLIALGASGTSSDIGDGSTLALIFPPQGGRVVFVGVRATNLDPCGVQLSGALRDLTTNEARPDVRTVNLAPTGDGGGASTDTNISTFANIPVCPNEWSVTDTYGHPYDLIVSVKDRGGRSASQTVVVTMTCAEPSNLAECLCICKAGYVLGQACDDGGVGDATGDGASDGGAE
jgi:hypothetical protein